MVEFCRNNEKRPLCVLLQQTNVCAPQSLVAHARLLLLWHPKKSSGVTIFNFRSNHHLGESQRPAGRYSRCLEADGGGGAYNYLLVDNTDAVVVVGRADRSDNDG